jgi:hypothetical protein
MAIPVIILFSDQPSLAMSSSVDCCLLDKVVDNATFC